MILAAAFPLLLEMQHYSSAHEQIVLMSWN
jgi:hypothetical protein